MFSERSALTERLWDHRILTRLCAACKHTPDCCGLLADVGVIKIHSSVTFGLRARKHVRTDKSACLM